MKHRYIALFFAGIVAFQALYNVGVVSYWLLNRAQIALELCENKDQPEMHCDGKCYLKKKINPKADAAPVEQKSESLPIQKGLDLAEVILRPELPVWHFVSAVQVLVPTEKTLLVQCLQRTVFRPPVFTT